MQGVLGCLDVPIVSVLLVALVHGLATVGVGEKQPLLIRIVQLNCRVYLVIARGGHDDRAVFHILQKAFLTNRLDEFVNDYPIANATLA